MATASGKKKTKKRIKHLYRQMACNVRRYISVADYEARNYQINNKLNTIEDDTRNTETAIEYTCCYTQVF